MTHPEISFDGHILSQARDQTPHGIAFGARASNYNEDYGLYVPGVGLVVADGAGGANVPEHSAAISKLATEVVFAQAQRDRLAEMPADEARGLFLSQILPKADSAVGEYKSGLSVDREQLQQLCTVIGGLLVGRNNTLLAFGAGDIRVLRYPNGQIIPQDLVKEQIVPRQPNIVTNYLAGEGRQNPNPDQSTVVRVAPGDRLLVTSDGFHGDHDHQRVPEWIIGEEIPDCPTPKALAERLSRLPLELADKHPHAFFPKLDDLTIGALYVKHAAGQPS